MNTPTTLVIDGVTISNFRLMDSRRAGICDLCRRKFPVGTQILYKGPQALTPQELEFFGALGGNVAQYGIAVIWEEALRASQGEATQPEPVRTPSMTDFEPSEYQEKIRDVLFRTGKNILISALAGCGKTSTLVWLIWLLVNKGLTKGREVYFLAFNGNIRDEVTPELQGSGVPALTTHQFCLRNVLKYKHSKMEKERGDRNRRIFLKVIMDMVGASSEQEAKRSGFWFYRSFVLKLVPLVKNWAICPKFDGKGWIFNADQRQQVDHLINLYKLDPKSELDAGVLRDLACTVISYSLPAPGIAPAEYDFDDMLYHVMALDLPIHKVDLVFVDEVQDLSAIQIRILAKMEIAGTRIVAVGDWNQAIYMFRGADSRAWDKLIASLEGSRRGLEKCDLPINYRSEPEVLDYAQQLVPGLIPFKSRTGKGRVCFDTTFDSMMGMFKTESRKPQPRKIAVLCRNRAPLVQAGYAAIGEGLVVCFLGKGDLTKPLHDMINRVAGYKDNRNRCNRISDLRDGNVGRVQEEGFLTRLGVYIRNEKAKYEGHEDKADFLEEMSDTAECLRVIAAAVKDDQVDSIRREIDCRFVSKPIPGSITFTTGHGAKGLQWPIVCIIRKDLMPSPRVQQFDKDGKITDEFQQELNLDYIARTRAQTETHVICDWPFGKGMGEIVEHGEQTEESQNFWSQGADAGPQSYDDRLFAVPTDHPTSAPPTGWGVRQPIYPAAPVEKPVTVRRAKKFFVDDNEPF